MLYTKQVEEFAEFIKDSESDKAGWMLNPIEMKESPSPSAAK